MSDHPLLGFHISGLAEELHSFDLFQLFRVKPTANVPTPLLHELLLATVCFKGRPSSPEPA